MDGTPFFRYESQNNMWVTTNRLSLILILMYGTRFKMVFIQNFIPLKMKKIITSFDFNF